MRLAQKLTLTLVGGLILIVAVMAAYPYFATQNAISSARTSMTNVSEMVLTTTGTHNAKAVAYAEAATLTSYMESNNVTTVSKLTKDPVLIKTLRTIYYGNPSIAKMRMAFIVKNESGSYVLYYSEGRITISPVKAYISSISSSSNLSKIIERALNAPTDTFVSGTYTFGNSRRFGAFYVPARQPLMNSKLIIWVDIPRGSYVTNAFGKLTEQDLINSILQELDPVRRAISTSVFIGALLSILTIFVLVYRVNKDISLPIVKLAEVSNSIADGEIEAKVPFQERDDEIGILAKAIERVRRSLEIAVKTLEEFT